MFCVFFSHQCVKCAINFSIFDTILKFSGKNFKRQIGHLGFQICDITLCNLELDLAVLVLSPVPARNK
jgi:hypothetical protein